MIALKENIFPASIRNDLHPVLRPLLAVRGEVIHAVRGGQAEHVGLALLLPLDYQVGADVHAMVQVYGSFQLVFRLISVVLQQELV